MTKANILIIGLSLVAIILVIVAITKSGMSPLQQTATQTPTPIAPGASQFNNITPTKKMFPFPTGNTTIIDGVTTNNFYKASTVFNTEGDLEVGNADSYRIVYLPGSKQFLITIIGHGFDQNRQAAEQAFLNALGISQTAACQLNVTVQTTSSANPDQAGQSYGLSFCPQKTTQTAAGSKPTPIMYGTIQSLDINVGNVPTTGGGSFALVAQAITNNLSRSGGTLFDQFAGHPRGTPATMTLPPGIQKLFPSYRVILRQGSNIGPRWRYWCTDLIIDTYNLALGKRLLGENLGAVQSQVTFWKTEGKGFSYVRYVANHQGALNKLFSSQGLGGPIFWESQEGTYNGGEHVGLIKNGSIDSHGNGEIDTYEANAGHTSGKYPIVGWQVKNVPYPVVGFGLYAGK